MEQELIELLLFSKKALSTGKTICAQANTCLQTSEQHVETIAKIHPKLVFVNNHIIVQTKIVEQIKDYLDAQTESCKDRIKEHETHLQTLTLELTNVFNLLKKRKIDKDILQVNKERMNDSQSQHEYKSLFDYISDQGIIELQRQADDEIGEIETVNNLLQKQSKMISTFLLEITKSKNNALLPIASLDVAFSNEKIQAQEDEISNMAEILISLTNHYDQLGEAMRIYQSDVERRDELDITVLKDDHEHIPHILEDLGNRLYIVESINEEIEVRVQLYLKVKDDLIKILNQFESFGDGQAKMILEKMLDTEHEIKERELNLEEYFKQLSSLAEWYRCYASSYNYLLLEIERRKRAQEKQDSIRRELLKSFEEAYHDELQERRSWAAQHGQYLPEVLCPFINDSPSMLRIEIESESKRLPNLSSESIKRALAEIHNNNNNITTTNTTITDSNTSDAC
ncbi:autophagy-related protein 17 [Cokeromyces recurvatus]|uniref:autophagy-related protein 17 n=1 Tax=Cokeromyces recurvatus TaxID=90255 RepID=UPI00221EA63D|nr:autophagy-related protein 17 [Cokeromyces recurvatus]KAI7907717.1 autophagy-related protein 17 [Cokeromyces recurvatus]